MIKLLFGKYYIASEDERKDKEMITSNLSCSFNKCLILFYRPMHRHWLYNFEQISLSGTYRLYRAGKH